MTIEKQDEIQEDTTSMEEKIEALNECPEGICNGSGYYKQQNDFDDTEDRRCLCNPLEEIEE